MPPAAVTPPPETPLRRCKFRFNRLRARLGLKRNLPWMRRWALIVRGSLATGRPLLKLAAELPGELSGNARTQRRVLRFLARRGFKQVALYNDTAAARALAVLLRRNGIEVSYMFTSGGESYPVNGCRAYQKLRRDMPVTDAVIVTAPVVDPTLAYLEANVARRQISMPVYPVFELVSHRPPLRQPCQNYMYFRDLDPAQYPAALRRWYRGRLGRELDLEHPVTYNEKIQWMKLYGMAPYKTLLSDKLRVKEWVARTIGEQYVIPLLAVYERAEDVDFAALPQRFAMKCNHGSNMNIFVNGKYRVDFELLRKMLAGWMTVNFAFRNGLEMQYAGIERRIIVERRLLRNHEFPGLSYRFWCFAGEPHYIEVAYTCKGRMRLSFFDLDWQRLPFTRECQPIVVDMPRPSNLDTMLDLVRKLARGIDHVRVDLYRMPSGRIFFSEMTFTSSSGVNRWSDPRVDYELGKLLDVRPDAPLPEPEPHEPPASPPVRRVPRRPRLRPAVPVAKTAADSRS